MCKAVLIVSDDTSTLDLMSVVLSANGFSPVGARTVEEARALARQTAFELVVADRRIGPHQTLDQALKHTPELSGVPVMTIYGMGLNGHERVRKEARFRAIPLRHLISEATDRFPVRSRIRNPHYAMEPSRRNTERFWLRTAG